VRILDRGQEKKANQMERAQTVILSEMFCSYKSPVKSAPMKNVDGRVIEFDFDPPVNYVKNIGLLDVDYATVIRISFFNEDDESKDAQIAVPILGDNSYQLFSLATDKVTGPVTKLSIVKT
jgi:hypothetical protein